MSLQRTNGKTKVNKTLKPGERPGLFKPEKSRVFKKKKLICVVRKPDEWSEENDEVQEVLRYAVRMEKGVCRYGQSLWSLVNFSLKVDDVLIMAKKAHY